MKLSEHEELVIQLRHAECDEDCERPCKIMTGLLDRAADEIEELRKDRKTLVLMAAQSTIERQLAVLHNWLETRYSETTKDTK